MENASDTIQRKDATGLRGFLLVILASVLYGGMPSLSQRAFLAGLSVEQTLTGRYVVGTLLIWAFIAITKKKAAVSFSLLMKLFLVGIDIFVCVFSMTSSYVHLPGAVASILVFMYIVLVNVFEFITGRTRPTPIRIVCIALTFIGLGFVVYTPGEGVVLPIKGIAFALIAALLYACWALSMDAKVFKGISPEVMMGYTLIVPTLINSVKCIAGGQSLFPSTGMGWLFIVLLGLTPGFIAPIAFSTGVRLISPGKASIINTSEPVFAFVFGLILMGDHIRWNAVVGGIIVISGIALLRISGGREEAEAS